MDSTLLTQVCNTLHRLETYTFVQNAVEEGSKQGNKDSELNKVIHRHRTYSPGQNLHFNQYF